MDLNVIIDPLYNFYSKNKETIDRTEIECNLLINGKKRKTGIRCNVIFRTDYIVEATIRINKDEEISLYYIYCNVISQKLFI